MTLLIEQQNLTITPNKNFPNKRKLEHCIILDSELFLICFSTPQNTIVLKL